MISSLISKWHPRNKKEIIWKKNHIIEFHSTIIHHLLLLISIIPIPTIQTIKYSPMGKDQEILG